jgi:hypothetical protein
MNKKLLGHKRVECNCRLIDQCPGGWVYAPHPFEMKAEEPRKGLEDKEYVKTLVCSCGKEVGEVEFSGYYPGRWRKTCGDRGGEYGFR